MATISTLAVNLIARTSVFERGMRRSRGSMKRFKAETVSTTARVASFAKGLLISGGAVFAIKSFTEAASRAQETMNLFNTVFAENAAATSKWADTFATDVGRSKTEVREWAATLQDTFVPLGFARDRAAELSKSLVELAVDVGSFKNIASDREVIDSFSSAIVGNHRAVRAYGVVLTNATIEQEAFRSGINKTFTKLSELEKVQLRYNIIMRSTTDAQGDAIKTAGNYANQLKKLKGQWVDIKESIGNLVIPAMTKLVTLLTTHNKSIGEAAVRISIFAAKLLATIVVVKAISLAIKGIALAYRAVAIAQAIVLSLGGPAGWAAIAAGVAIATAAIIGINKVLDDAIDKMRDIENIKPPETPTFVALGADKPSLIDERAKTLKRIAILEKEIFFWRKAGLQVPDKLDELKEKRNMLIQIAEQLDIIGDQELLAAKLKFEKAAFEDVKKVISDIRQQIRDFGLTKIEIEIRDLKKLKDTLAPDALIIFNEKLEKAAELYQLFIDKQKKAADLKELINESKQLKESLLNPIEKLIVAQRRFNEMMESGLITASQFDAAMLRSGKSIMSSMGDTTEDIKDAIQKLKEQGSMGLGDEFISGIKEMEGLLAELTQKEYLGKLAEEAKELKESLKSPAEKILDIRENLASMLEQGFINSDEFDEALAKAKEGLAGKEQGFGRFSEIRSEFIDVAALQGSDKKDFEDENLQLLREQNRLLRIFTQRNDREFQS